MWLESKTIGELDEMVTGSTECYKVSIRRILNKRKIREWSRGENINEWSHSIREWSMEQDHKNHSWKEWREGRARGGTRDVPLHN